MPQDSMDAGDVGRDRRCAAWSHDAAPTSGGVPAWLIDEQTASIRHRDPRPATWGDMPPWVADDVRDALAAQGIERLWSHQVEAAQAAFDGHDVAIATGTASGKTLAYLLPVIAATRDKRYGRPTAEDLRRERLHLGPVTRRSALYVAPTKALAHDQLRACEELGIEGFQACTLDGDSDRQERSFAQDYAGYVLTNPDMLHRSVLPSHERWGPFFSGLTYVIVDEAHRYKGVFGAQVAMVLRRLRRIAHLHGADPVFIFSSATIADAGAVGCALAGLAGVTVVDRDGSPAPALDFVIRRPTASATVQAGDMLARLSTRGQTLAFTTSRVQAEVIAQYARDKADQPSTIAAYRGGYLAADRRELEHDLSTGRLKGVACTNALELGVDISGMDAVVSVGFPGTVSALWQQVGRAGRHGHDALAVLMAREDPLDAYLADHPDLIFDAPLERTVIYVENPYVMGPHLAAAAQESPLTPADEAFFGPTMTAMADTLAAQGVLRRRPQGWFWPHAERAADAIDLRSMQGKAYEVVDESTGRVIGQVDAASADRTLHPEAIYLHQGEYWIIRGVHEADRVALAGHATGDYFTQPLGHKGIRVLGTDESRPLGLGEVSYGTIELSSQVIGYLRRDSGSGDVWDQTPLDMPLRTMTTKAVWWTLPADVVDALDVLPGELAGGVHAAEHAAIGLLPALVPCDRWDIGGVSTVLHPDTGKTTVFVHDGSPGGSGFARMGYQRAEAWWASVLERLTTCQCEGGCPACVVSPKCGSGNDPLDKRAAAELVRVLTMG